MVYYKYTIVHLNNNHHYTQEKPPAMTAEMPHQRGFSLYALGELPYRIREKLFGMKSFLLTFAMSKEESLIDT